MTEKEESENQGFKVKDRRRFRADGSSVAENESEPERPTEALPAESSPEPEPQETEIPVDFASLLLSIAAGAQAGMNEKKNLAQAKYSIDLLGMLEQKTKGNLESEEARLLETLLYDLRMRYVEAKSS